MVSCVTKEPKLRPMMTCQLGFHRSSKCLLIFSAAASPAPGPVTRPGPNQLLISDTQKGNDTSFVYNKADAEWGADCDGDSSGGGGGGDGDGVEFSNRGYLQSAFSRRGHVSLNSLSENCNTQYAGRSSGPSALIIYSIQLPRTFSAHEATCRISSLQTD